MVGLTAVDANLRSAAHFSEVGTIGDAETQKKIQKQEVTF